MATIDAQISSASSIISNNIANYAGNRALLSQNLLAQLRNLVEAVVVRLHLNDGSQAFSYDLVGPAIAWSGSQNKRVSFLQSFHKLLQSSASHYSFEGDPSERLMLKYFEYSMKVRNLVLDETGLQILPNLENFPIDLDPSLREYHEKIAQRLADVRQRGGKIGRRERYYIHRIRPFIWEERTYYEVTFSNAVNNTGKFDRMIAFTDIQIDGYYASNMTLLEESITILGQTMPILLVTGWEVSIRPCELNNFAKLFGLITTVNTSQREYRQLMRYLTVTATSLLELLDSSDRYYSRIRSIAVGQIKNPSIFPALDAARHILNNQAPGHNILRYLLLRMNNVLLKKQYHPNLCQKLSNLHLSYGCIPFDKMPFCTSLMGHNPRLLDLLESIDPDGRQHEFLARHVRNKVERGGNLYTPEEDLGRFEDLESLIQGHNASLYYKHVARRSLAIDKRHVFQQGYEDDTFDIINGIQEFATSGIAGYESAIRSWLDESLVVIDDEAKRDALIRMFANTRVAIIYGAAGTGKSTLVNLLAGYFNDQSKLFLTHTHPAKDNLQRRVKAQRSQFRTIRSHLRRNNSEENFDIVIIDECSTVCNADMLQILKRDNFGLLVLVGDVFQIESIEFGNWFDVIRAFVPREAVFELTTPYRTKNPELLGLWDRVRNLEDDIDEWITHHDYSTKLDQSLFTPRQEDEIILCLNYDGIYGINNVNRFLQSSNPGESVIWDVSTYKVGDPIIFNDTGRFGSLIYNNLKGRIVSIALYENRVQFDVSLGRRVTSFDVRGTDLLYIDDSTVRFSVYSRGSTDEDNDESNTVVPFQVAYAVSIHKAQGLEYDSVKIVITDANEEDVSHSVFYTAITRARNQLQIFWSPETQRAVINRLENRKDTTKDVGLLRARRGVTPIR